MEQSEEKIVEEIKKAVTERIALKKAGKSPLETRWNLPESEKPVEA